jgi:hypothetical protein
LILLFLLALIYFKMPAMITKCSALSLKTIHRSAPTFVARRALHTTSKQSLSSLATAPSYNNEQHAAVPQAVVVNAWVNQKKKAAPAFREQEEEILWSTPLLEQVAVPQPLQTNPMEQVQRGPMMRDAFGNDIEVVTPRVSAKSETVELAGELILEQAKKSVEKLQEVVLEPVEPAVKLDKAAMDQMMNHVQFSSPDSALGFVHVSELLTERELKQLQSKLKARVKYGKEMPQCIPQDTHHTNNNDGPGFVQKMMNWMQLS